PLVVDDALIERARAELPELPDAKRERFMSEYELPPYDASILTGQRPLADYYEAAVKATKARPKTVANWVLGELMGALNRAGLEIGDSRVAPEQLAALLDRIEDGTISGKIAKDVFETLWNEGGDVAQIIESRGLVQITDREAIEALVDDVISAYPEQVQQYRDGKTQVLGFLVGQVMKASRGKANPQQVHQVLRARLESPYSSRARTTYGCDSKADGMNEVQSFLLEGCGIRGALVRLEETWQQVVAQHNYAPDLKRLLGESVAATVLLASSLKSNPRVSMQLQGEGALKLLLIQCTEDLR